MEKLKFKRENIKAILFDSGRVLNEVLEILNREQGGLDHNDT